MIERNNIIEAAEQAFANVRKPKNSACMKVGFLRGVDWFKHAIWHGANEQPEEGEQILYLVTEEDEIVDAKVTITALYDFIPWSEVVSNFGISVWCYFNDLLPKYLQK